MYADFYGLREQPFNNTHGPRFFYSTPAHEEALASLIYTVGEKKGLTLLTGEAGTGKTLLIRLMLAHFGERVAFAELGTTPLSQENILAAICADLGVSLDPQGGIEQAIHSLQNYLFEQFARNKPVVIIVDDAHCLPVQTLEQLRFIANIESRESMLLQIVLAGQLELCETMNHPKLRPLSQRCFRANHLPALTREQVGAYIGHRIAVAGGKDQRLFDASSKDAVHEVSGGIPRLINTVCDNVLLSAFAADRKQIDAELVRSVSSQTMRFKDVRSPDAVPTDSMIGQHAGADSFANPTEGHAVLFAETAHAAALGSRLAAIEHRIATLATPLTHALQNQQVIEIDLAGRIASLEQKSAVLSRQQTPAAPDVSGSVATRLGGMEKKLEQLLVSQDATLRRVEDSTQKANSRLEQQIASTKAITDDTLRRIKEQSQKAKSLAATVKAVIDKQSADVAADAGVRAARRPMASPLVIERGDLLVSARTRTATPKREFRDGTAAIDAEHRIELLRARVDSAFAHSPPTQRLLHNIRGLTRLAEGVPDTAEDTVESGA